GCGAGVVSWVVVSAVCCFCLLGIFGGGVCVFMCGCCFMVVCRGCGPGLGSLEDFCGELVVEV
ncbi:hypothetical protein RA267_28420, partial [Pseudomonas syringae pv. tagetis]|uniref:hypothetical protein n=1 Tax=Pseudomonas syringae group genomosp. 7 TaxID=251699 RepID=UPI0037703469